MRQFDWLVLTQSLDHEDNRSFVDEVIGSFLNISSGLIGFLHFHYKHIVFHENELHQIEIEEIVCLALSSL